MTKNVFITTERRDVSEIEKGNYLFFPNARIEEVMRIADGGFYARGYFKNSSKEKFGGFPYIRKTVFYEMGTDKKIYPVTGGETLEVTGCKKNPRISRFERNLNDMGIVLKEF